MIRIENAIKFLKEELNEKFSKNETLSLIRILFEDLLMISKTQMLSQPEKKISAEQLEALRKACEKLLQSEPIQYITGKSYFCGNVFNVRPGVLIPRPETEELVELICEQNREKDNFRILDIGTGSGCIAISLAKMFKNSTVFALDFSIEALGIAKENARINDVDIKLLHENILVQKKINILQEFDIVVSNPPYVTESEKKHMAENVLLFEPETALFVSNDDPLIFYKTIVNHCEKNLISGGMLYFEINENFGYETAQILKNSGFFSGVVVKNDMFGKNRFVYGQKTG